MSIVGLRYRDYESIYVGEALASNSRLKPLPHYIKTMTYKIKKLFLCCFHNTFTVSIANPPYMLLFILKIYIIGLGTKSMCQQRAALNI